MANKKNNNNQPKQPAFLPKIDTNALRRRVSQKYNNQFYNLWQSSRKWKGISPERASYLMKMFWGGYTYEVNGIPDAINGTVWAFKLGHKDGENKVIEDAINEVAFVPYAPFEWNMDDAVEKVTLINKKGNPLIPQGVQVANKDGVIGYATKGHNSIFQLLSPYIDELVEIDMVANVQLKTLNMPFLIAATGDDLKKIQDLLLRILNNEPAIVCEIESKDLIDVLQVKSDFIIDRLRDHRVAIYNEALTLIGIDNMGSIEKKAQMSKDETNSNNMLIASFQVNIDLSLQDFCDKIKEVLGAEISFESSVKNGVYDKEDVPDIADDGNIDTKEGKPAPKEAEKGSEE